VNDLEIDALVRRTTPITAAAVDGLPLAAELTALREEIARPETAVATRPSWTRRSGRWLAAAAVALLIGGAVVVTNVGDDDSAYAAEAVRVARAVPRLLVTADGWEVTRADEFSVELGEVTFSRGNERLDLHWRTAAEHDGYVDDRAHSSGPPVKVEVDGHDGVLFRYVGTDEYTALWLDGDHSLEFRGVAGSVEEFRSLLDSLEEVSVDDWLAAMPASAVQPADRAETIAAMLDPIPLPPGFDTAVFDRVDGSAVSDRYQLGAQVTGAVACAWIDRWVAADAAGDAVAKQQAADAIGSSRTWPILHEMDVDGDYPEVLWEYADDITVRDGGSLYGNDRIRTGGYRESLGCD
jgi:hypothetical protein